MTIRLTLLTILGAFFLLNSGCTNDCQKLCKEVANYWDDCGISYADNQVADCRKNFAGNGDDFETYETSCRQLVRPAENADGERVIGLRARFSCEDMENGPGGAFANGG